MFLGGVRWEGVLQSSNAFKTNGKLNVCKLEISIRVRDSVVLLVNHYLRDVSFSYGAGMEGDPQKIHDVPESIFKTGIPVSKSDPGNS